MRIPSGLLRSAYAAVLVCGCASVFTFPKTVYDSCPETCCCKACSDPGHDSYPYGPLSVSFSDAPKEAGGPMNPKLQGDLGLCQIPTWALAPPTYYDDDGNTSTPDIPYAARPNTIWWSNAALFGDDDLRVAPPSCQCCRFSGIDTNCMYEAPPASRPVGFSVVGDRYPGFGVKIEFYGGIELSSNDMAEIRSDPHCGYVFPIPVLTNTTLVPIEGDWNNATRVRWEVPELPGIGCYKLCYYHAGLTTPTWFDMGSFDVLSNEIQGTVGDAPLFTIPEEDLLIQGRTVRITPTKWGSYSIFNDAMEMRTTGTSCGSGTPAAVSSELIPAADYDWCNPAVPRRVSADRPRRVLPTLYEDCPPENRLLVPSVTWEAVLPPGGDYRVCYRRQGVWDDLGPLHVERVTPVDKALLNLFNSTQGSHWYHKHGWGTSDPLCSWYGVSCDKDRVTSISLARNNLQGSIPDSFAFGDFTDVVLLNLERNGLSGTVPTALGAWSSLRSLDLGYNSLSGTVPAALSNCPLWSVYLPDNLLTGELPYDLRSLHTVRIIWTEGGGTSLVPLEVPQAVKYITDQPASARCPSETWFCPATGERTPGVLQCGYDSIKEENCRAIGCCWNPQSTGKPCFSKKRASFDAYPVCTSPACTPQNQTEGTS